MAARRFADQVKGKGLGLAGHEPTLARVQLMTPLRVTSLLNAWCNHGSCC
jgi:hypothetical protein